MNRGAWWAPPVKRLTLDIFSGHDLKVVRWKPALDSLLGMVCLSFSLTEGRREEGRGEREREKGPDEELIGSTVLPRVIEQRVTGIEAGRTEGRRGWTEAWTER